jgi:hypothetical protein
LTKAIVSFIRVSFIEIVEFQWDDDNVAPIAAHMVRPDEVEEFVFEDDPWIRKGRGGTRYMLGYTVSGHFYSLSMPSMTGSTDSSTVTLQTARQKPSPMKRPRCSSMS